MQASPERLLEAPALVLVLAITALRSISTEDVQFYDETSYLASGLAIRNGDLPGFTAGATYADFYFLLSRLTADPVGLYFAGRATAAVLLVLGVWVSARLLSNSSLAWVAAAVVAASPMPYVWPGVAAPAAGLILAGVSLAIRFPGPASLGAGSAMVWLAAGARPELAWVAAVWSVTSLVALVGAFRARRPGLVGAVVGVAFGAFAVPAALLVLHGSPFSSSGREWIAFQQHFSLRHVTDGLDPWLDSAAIVSQFFPGAGSVSEAILTSPGAFASHVGSNLLEAPLVIVRDVLGIQSGDVAALIGMAMAVTVLSSMALALVLDLDASRSRALRVWTGLRARSRWGAWVGLAAILMSIVLSVSLVYPRHHYLLVPAAGIIVGAVAVQHHVGSSRLTAILPITAAVVLFALLSMQMARLAITRAAYPAPVAATITRMIESGQDWRLLGGSQGLPIYVPRLQEVTDAQPLPDESFIELLDRLAISTVLTGSTETSAWASMPGFGEFIDDPTQYGFESPFAGSQLWLRSP